MFPLSAANEYSPCICNQVGFLEISSIIILAIAQPLCIGVVSMDLFICLEMDLLEIYVDDVEGGHAISFIFPSRPPLSPPPNRH